MKRFTPSPRPEDFHVLLALNRILFALWVLIFILGVRSLL